MVGFPQLPAKILAQDRIAEDSCLGDAIALDARLFDSLMDARFVFYPGSGCDAQGLRLFGSSGAAQCIVHADLTFKPSQAVARISRPFCHDYRYKIFSSGFLEPNELDAFLPPLDLAGVSLDTCCRLTRAREIHAPGDAFWCIFERQEAKKEEVGNRILLLQARVEAHLLFARLCASAARRPYGILLQDHFSFSNSWTPFGGASLLASLAEDLGAFPDWLLTDETTLKWQGYKRVSLGDKPAGMNGNVRWLERRVDVLSDEDRRRRELLGFDG